MPSCTMLASLESFQGLPGCWGETQQAQLQHMHACLTSAMPAAAARLEAAVQHATKQVLHESVDDGSHLDAHLPPIGVVSPFALCAGMHCSVTCV